MGTGLGLAICRRPRGPDPAARILLESETWAAAAPSRSPCPPPSVVDARPSDPDMPTLAVSPASGPILVAEDHDAEPPKALARVLRGLGYRVLEAEDGREAVDPRPPEASGRSSS